MSNDCLKIEFIPFAEFEKVKKSSIDKFNKLQLISDMCRVNAFSEVKKAGSGHLGSSLSALDIFTLLYLDEMNTVSVGLTHPDRDIFFSSKGHDCPGQYAVFFAAGIVPFEKLILLRRLGGLDGHPDVKIPGVEANSGSLGMGISKAKGIALAKQLNGSKGRVFVMTGDGELQEGQIWESLQTTSYQKCNNITVIIDHNKIQTDKLCSEIIDIGDIAAKFALFGWHVERCDGHNFQAMNNVFNRLKTIDNKPKAIIADTIKGKGISFMEGAQALRDGDGLYKWHSGAPNDNDYERGLDELIESVNRQYSAYGLGKVSCVVVETREKNRVALKTTAEKVVSAYGEALVEWGAKRKDIVVLDADLSADCGVRDFENAFPSRFLEHGIAEQDMVSTAGGLALQGYLPIVNSFGVFLASRANEQIYANATEKTKIIYACHYAGLIPAGPGKSHQSLRDISLLGSLPNLIALEPCNAFETKQVVDWCISEATENCLIRLIISPSPRAIELPEDYAFTYGKGSVLHDGADAVLFSYGPVMLNEALTAAEILRGHDIQLKVVNMPWLNRIDLPWLEETVGECPFIYTLDNHFAVGGLGDCILNSIIRSKLLVQKNFFKFAVTEFPACGTPQEALQFHHLDGRSIAEAIVKQKKYVDAYSTV